MARRMRRSSSTRSVRGSVMVETVFTIGLMLFIVFAGLEISWAMYKKAEVSNAARVVVRAASLADATAGSVQQVAIRQMEIAGFDASEWQLELQPSDPSGVAGGDPISAEISVDYGSVSLGKFGGWIPVPDELSSIAVMLKEGAN
jgi:hypothetical protein